MSPGDMQKGEMPPPASPPDPPERLRVEPQVLHYWRGDPVPMERWKASRLITIIFGQEAELREAQRAASVAQRIAEHGRLHAAQAEYRATTAEAGKEEWRRAYLSVSGVNRASKDLDGTVGTWIAIVLFGTALIIGLLLATGILKP